jgi:hypothetical protein
LPALERRADLQVGLSPKKQRPTFRSASLPKK